MPDVSPRSAAPMHLPLLLLLLLLPRSVSPQCQVATAEECEEHKDFVPGHSLAGDGIDITTLEKRGGKLLDMNRWQKPDGTCTLCQNQLLPDKPLQRLPLAAMDWEVKTMCQQKVHTSLQSNGFGVVNAAGSDVQNDWKLGLDIQVKPQTNVQVALAASHSKTADFSLDKGSQDKYSFAKHEVSCTYYSFRIGHKQLSNHFKHALHNLPRKYRRETQLEYRQLIDTYGTHFIRRVHLGGRIRDVTAMRECESVLNGVTSDEVKDCLSIEAAASIGKVKMDAAYKTCEEMKKKRAFKGSFHQAYRERHTEVVGGTSHIDLLFSDNHSPETFNEWLKGVISVPGLISYSLNPIHILVPKGNPRRESLQQAVREYVTERALWRNCTQPCPPGTQRSARDPCSCVCPSDSTTSSMCCSRKRGLGKLTVKIQRAHGLWGDHFTRTDAYVKVLYQGRESRTPTVWNNDNPVWNIHLDLGNIQVLGENSKLQIQVWDEDNKYDDDRLGLCEKTLESGKLHNKVCFLDHGRLDFQYQLICGPYLGGPFCLDYVPQMPKSGEVLLRKGKAVTVKQKAP